MKSLQHWELEAARNSLINELKATLENQGLEVDVRYLMLVADLYHPHHTRIA